MAANYKSYLNWLIKCAILILSVIFIWKKLGHNQDLANFPKLVSGLHTADIVWVLTSLTLLMLLNWITEAYKWQLQLEDVAPISLWMSIQAVFCGTTVGIITPNRIGDYGTRVFFLKPPMRVYGFIAVGIAGLAQFIVINMMAGVAICIFLYRFKAVNAGFIAAIAVGFAVYCTLLLLLLFNMRVIRGLINKLKFLNRYQQFFHSLYNYKSELLVKILVICLFRIAILFLQYFIIIHLLIPAITFWEIMLMVTLLFSFQTVVPTIEILDIGIRGATAVYFFSFVTHQDVSILASTSVIWFINLILPAIIGLCFVYKLKVFNQVAAQS